jgi:hypothetical protein
MRRWQIEQWVLDPVAVQREVLQDLVTSAQYTEIGRRYDFSKLFSIKEFKKSVPIHEYDDLKPYIQRIMQGEENLLWNTPINWFAKSSGTTSDRSKFIPVSEESLQDNHYLGAKDVLTMYYHFHPDSDLLTGKGLVIGGSHTISQFNAEVQYGDLSAVLLQNSPFWGNWIRTPELHIALLDEWENKIEQLAESTVRENVTSISGVPTWTLVLMKKILENTGKKNIMEVWPSLELYIHGGVSFTPYREQFSKIIGGNINYLEMYNASEGFFAAQDYLRGWHVTIHQSWDILEFMPWKNMANLIRKPLTKRRGIGKNYAPVSTNGGLWRYLLGIPFSLPASGLFASGKWQAETFYQCIRRRIIVENADKAIFIAVNKAGAVV